MLRFVPGLMLVQGIVDDLVVDISSERVDDDARLSFRHFSLHLMSCSTRRLEKDSHSPGP